jgi:hypothetical protein
MLSVILLNDTQANNTRIICVQLIVTVNSFRLSVILLHGTTHIDTQYKMCSAAEWHSALSHILRIKCVKQNVTINSILLSVILLNGIHVNYYTQPKNKMCSAKCHNQFQYAECHSAECRGARQRLVINKRRLRINWKQKNGKKSQTVNCCILTLAQPNPNLF